MQEARCALGAYAVMSESQPKAYTPLSCAVCSTADESVFCSSTSAPCPIRVSAAWRSLLGSNQVLIHTTLVVILGFTLRAPIVNALMLRTTSGIGNEATKPSTPFFDMCPAMIPARYAGSYMREV